MEIDKKIANEIEHGKKISENAEEVWGWSSPAGKLRAQRRANFFIDLGKLNRTTNALEIGCGTALFTEKIYFATYSLITAIDISQELLDQGRKKLPDVDFRLEDAMALSFADNTFDVVYGSSILHHLQFDKALSEIYRVLKPGGRIIFAEPNMLNPQIFIQKNVPFIKKWLGDSPDETAVVRWPFAKLMAKTGFNNIELFPYDFLHPNVPQSLISFVDKLGKSLERIPMVREIAGSVIIYGTK